MNETQGATLPERFRRRILLRAGIPAGRSLPKFSRAADQYRNLAMHVEERRPNLAPQLGYVVAVIGAEPGCGKTLTSLNLSFALTRGWDRRVLLVEADIWKPSLSEYMEIEPGSPGLAQVLLDEAKERDAIAAVCERGRQLSEAFSVLPAGARTGSEDVIVGPKTKTVIDSLRLRWERVILDCPPMELAAGRALALCADLVLLVVRAGQTNHRQVERTLAALGPDCRIAFVMNAVRESKRSYGDYYG
jgi:Mrp family chromosome partitioning ATPase